MEYKIFIRKKYYEISMGIIPKRNKGIAIGLVSSTLKEDGLQIAPICHNPNRKWNKGGITPIFNYQQNIIKKARNAIKSVDQMPDDIYKEASRTFPSFLRILSLGQYASEKDLERIIINRKVNNIFKGKFQKLTLPNLIN